MPSGKGVAAEDCVYEKRVNRIKEKAVNRLRDFIVFERVLNEREGEGEGEGEDEMNECIWLFMERKSISSCLSLAGW